MTLARPASPLEQTVFWFLCAAGLIVLMHALVPFNEFIHRGDDAYYYFKIAYNYPETGTWSFDSIHSTNGVQPLWAVILTAVAQVMAWVGLREPDLFARCAVGLTALFHVISCVLLFRLLARQVSLAVGAAAAAALLLPSGIVWQHVWGMENSLYAFLLVATLYQYLFGFRGRESVGRAAVLGLLLGLTVLARLNAGLLVICSVAALVLADQPRSARERMRLAVVAATASACCVVPYLLLNYATTGHPLPVSGAIKGVLTTHYLQDNGFESRFSLAYAQSVIERSAPALQWFFNSRIADGSAILGARALFPEEYPKSMGLLVLVSLLPFGFGPPKAWLAALGSAFARLRPLWFVLVYAALNLTVSVFLYPHQVGYAITRWWLVETEIVVVVVVCTVVGTALSCLGSRLVVPDVRHRLVMMLLLLLVLAHGQRFARVYWDGEYRAQDWNPSWNDEPIRAARWLAKEAPHDAVVGAWNAGVLGYHAKQRVTNLDGLINNFELLPYLRDRKLGAYITKNSITYLSDMESIFTRYKIHEQLKLREVYRHPNRFMKQDYVIYKVEP